jgi:adenine-specific DNA-methyltransferase
MLFDNNYFLHKFPEPQYLGAKYNLLGWLIKYIPQNINTVIDAFSGTQSVAFLFKQLGYQVFTNDFLTFNHQIGLSLIENKNQTLTKNDIEILFSQSPNKNQYTLMENVYTDLFFEKEQAYFLDNFRANIDFLENDYKKSLAFTLMNRSLQRKITMGHFAHTQALVYANNEQRIKRNPNLARPIQTIFTDLISDYNQAIFDNKKDNKSFSQNILDLLPELLKKQVIDLIYFDPPYCDSHADYQSFYHLAETYTEYWQDKQFVNTIKRYEPQKLSGFDKKRDVIESLETLFDLSKDIPYWLMSYNNRSYPDIDVLTAILKKYKTIEVETKTYRNSRGGKGSVAGSQEVLFICKPKPLFYINLEPKNATTSIV